MLQPKKTKFRKWHRLRNKHKGVATTGTRVNFGFYGLKAITGGEITARQIEAARRAISHAFKRGGKTWIRIFPHKPISRKAAEVPMGSGKGTVEIYVADIRKGTVIMEVGGVDEELAKKALQLASAKLPVKTRFVTKSFT